MGESSATVVRLVRVLVLTLCVTYGVLGLIELMLTLNGLRPGHRGARPLFADFMVFWSVGPALREGGLALLFDPSAFTAFQQQLLFEWWPHEWKLPRPWLYPPTFLFVAVPLASLPFALGAPLFQLGGVAALWAAMGRRKWMILWVLTSPAFWTTFRGGQNTSFIAALLIAGIASLPGSPWLAGLLLGLVSLKPQAFVLIPIALLAAREWRALVITLGTALILVMLSIAVFGWDAWHLWLQGVSGPSQMLSPSMTGVRGYGTDMGGIFSSAGLVGMSRPMQWLMQGLGATVGTVGTLIVFRRTQETWIRLAALCLGTLLVTPYWLAYDLLPIAVAMVLATESPLRNGWRRHQLVVGLCLWLLPDFMGRLANGGVPLAPAVVLAGLVTLVVHLKRKP